jgi:spermidine synthase
MHPSRVQRSTALFFLGLFLICMCGLMLQIVQTRVISVILWYHLAFLAISLAMLGMTVGALLVHFKPVWFSPERLLENLAWTSAAFSLTVALSTWSLITTIIPATTASNLVMTMAAWLKFLLILLPPYVFAGMAISLALTRSAWPVQLVYGVDLLGAATGCLLVLLLLNLCDGVSVLIAIAAFGAAAAACFAAARAPEERRRMAALPVARMAVLRHTAILASIFALVAVANSAIQPNGLVLMLSKGRLEFQKPAAVAWNSFSRVMVGNEVQKSPHMWGPSPTMPKFEVSERSLDIDGSAGTTMYRFTGALSDLNFLNYDITNLAYTIRNQGRAAVIGVGGGRDILSAYLFGFRDVTGVELNPIFVDLLTRRFRAYNRLADLPGVRLFVDEARSWFARTTERFDLIEMSLVDTWAATGVGAYSLSENGLYTVEGWQNFLNALTPTGVFTVSRWYNPEAVMETGRLLSLAAEALRRHGAARPEDHMFLAGTASLATLIVSASPLSAEDIARLRARADEMQFKVLVSPDQAPASPVLAQVLAARSPADFMALQRAYHIDLSVTTDDRPFFFNQLSIFDLQSIRIARDSQLGVVRGNLFASATIGMVIVLSGLLVLCAMIVPALPSLRETSRDLAIMGSLFFLLIGLGFMFVEIGLIQRISVFLGHPVYGLAIGLFGIIVSTGIGSLVSGRGLRSRGAIVLWACVLGTYLALLPWWLPEIVLTFAGSSLFVRASMSLLAIVPAGVLMGFGFPTGMRLVNQVDTRPTPWFWAVNGAAGVLAASLAVTVSVAFSINIALWIGAACYFLLSVVGLGVMSLRPHSDQRFLSQHGDTAFPTPSG